MATFPVRFSSLPSTVTLGNTIFDIQMHATALANRSPFRSAAAEPMVALVLRLKHVLEKRRRTIGGGLTLEETFSGPEDEARLNPVPLRSLHIHVLNWLGQMILDPVAVEMLSNEMVGFTVGAAWQTGGMAGGFTVEARLVDTTVEMVDEAAELLHQMLNDPSYYNYTDGSSDLTVDPEEYWVRMGERRMAALRAGLNREEAEEEEDGTCAVCLEEFKAGTMLGRLQNCAHAFHYACIVEWVKSSDSCPLCRRSVLVSDLSD